MAVQLINQKTGKIIEILKDKAITLGRGNILECLDARLSRKHISISYTDSSVLLSVVGINPCFIMKRGQYPIHIVRMRENTTLMHEDIISFLPDFLLCAFKVSLISDDDGRGSPSLLLESLSATNSNIKQEVADVSGYINDSQLLNNDSHQLLNSTHCYTTSNNVLERQTPSTQVTSDITPPARDSFSSSYVNINKIDRPPTPITPDLILSPSANAIQSTDDSPKNCSISTPSMLNTCDQSTDRPITVVPHDFVSEVIPCTSIKLETVLSNETEYESISSKANVLKKRLRTAIDDLNNDSSPSKRQACDENIAPSTIDVPRASTSFHTVPNNNPGQQPRPLCRYGSLCYRQNPQHKTAFSHPCDDDWVEEKLRELCPYDPNCYRRCLDHRINMRHTRDRQPTPEVFTTDDDDMDASLSPIWSTTSNTSWEAGTSLEE